MKILLITILPFVFVAYAGATSAPRITEDGITPSDTLQEEQAVSGTEMDLEKMNTSPNPVQGKNDESQGTIKIPGKKFEKRQKQEEQEPLDQPDNSPQEPQKNRNLDNENFIEEEQV